MDAFTEVGVEEVVAMTSAQVGKSEILLNVAGYSIDHSPGPIMILQPNAKPMGESFSKDRLAAMIRDTPTLRDKVKDPKSRDSDNTLMHKKFPGGHITIAGANANGYTATATPTSGAAINMTLDAQCTTFTINAQGQRGATGTAAANCW